MYRYQLRDAGNGMSELRGDYGEGLPFTIASASDNDRRGSITLAVVMPTAFAKDIVAGLELLDLQRKAHAIVAAATAADEEA